MQFHLLIAEIQRLSLAEKLHLRTLLDHFIREDRRAAINGNHLRSLEELQQGVLEFSRDPARLREMLEG